MTATQHSRSRPAAGQLIKHPTPAPSRKVSYGAAVGAMNTIALWAFTTATGVEIPAQVASAMTVVLMFIASYITKHRHIQSE